MSDNILVMDVEGTDGRERGEDQDFERKSALFALATSEVLIVNIWEHQVGLYQGANMGLLKTVFEVNLQLFLKDKQFGRPSPSLRGSRVRESRTTSTLALLPCLTRSFRLISSPRRSRSLGRGLPLDIDTANLACTVTKSSRVVSSFLSITEEFLPMVSPFTLREFGTRL
ncbi:hypothetical protein LB505_000453 [Fusarium chuoi]|nr:hypothetical protein LB505_000453 [Fusarium chuoi]